MRLTIDFNICLLARFLSKNFPEAMWVIESDNFTFFCAWIYIWEARSKCGRQLDLLHRIITRLNHYHFIALCLNYLIGLNYFLLDINVIFAIAQNLSSKRS